MLTHVPLTAQVPTTHLLLHIDANDIDGDGTLNTGGICNDGSTLWKDQSGNGNDVTMFNVANPCDESSGWDGDGSVSDPYRVTLDGHNDQFATAASVDSPQSFSIWFNADSISFANNESLFAHRLGGDSTEAFVHKGALHAHYKRSTDAVSTGISPNQWYNYAVTNDDTTTRHYLNGIEFASKPRDASRINTPLEIGHRAGQQEFDGSIANLRVYSTHLTPAEVSTIFEEERTRFHSDPSTPTINRVVPAIGSPTGGETITIYGWHLGDTTSVTIGGAPAANITAVTAHSITAQVPPNTTPGFYDIVVTTPSGSQTLPGSYRYTETRLDDLISHFDATNITSIGDKGNGATDQSWANLLNRSDVGLSAFAHPTDGDSGWQGNGSLSDPYRLTYDGNNNVSWTGHIDSPQSFSIWFNADSISFANNESLFAHRLGGDSTEAFVHKGALHAHYKRSTDAVSTGISPNQWYNYAVTNDDTTTRHYLNGIEFASKPRDASRINTPLEIGHRAGQQEFDGSIANLRVYSTHLTPAEVSTIFEEERTRFHSDPSTPTINRVVPAIGSPTGGETITIYGWHLDEVTFVNFGTIPGSRITHITPGSLTVQVPDTCVTVGAVDVEIASPSDADVAPDGFFISSVIDNLQVYYSATNVTAHGTKGDGTAETQWRSVQSPPVDAGLDTTFAQPTDGDSGWQGNGNLSDPYRLTYDGDNDAAWTGHINSPRTVSIWFNADSISSADNNSLFAHRLGSDSTEAYLHKGALHAHYKRSTDTVSTGISPNQWYNYAVTNDGTTTRHYLNGIEFASKPRDVSRINTPLQIGHREGQQEFDGSIANLRVYSTALSPSEVQTIVDEGVNPAEGSCIPECGNGDLDPGETCDPNAAGAPANCRPYPELAHCTYCGDEEIQSEVGEQCDDAGESATCNDDCTNHMCGDGNLNEAAGETCDDTNTIDGDGCSSTCQIEVDPECGNSIPEEGEDCDTGGESGTCDDDCTFIVCGDGNINEAANESCDDNNTIDGDGCSSTCQTESPVVPVCGNSVPEDGEECDTGGESATCDDDCTFIVCGDGNINEAASESCDDTNTIDGDGCSSTCQTESPVVPVCGNSVPEDGEDCDTGGESSTCDDDCTFIVCGDGNINEAANESCDDNNTIDGDGCSSSCQTEVIPVCGNSIPENGEDCDTGGESASCNADCTPSICGDTITNITANEACDDGNTIDGDGCDSQCQIEIPPSCGDGNIDDGEQCDDGNTDDTDECTSICIRQITQSSSAPSPQPETHGECQNNQCIEVEGEGTNECDFDSDCRDTKNYTACFRFECVVVAGQGNDQCTEHAHCLDDYHTICEDNQCKFVGGEGDNECIDDDQCIPEVTETHGECIQNQCVRIAGPGPDECIADDDCLNEVPHTECRDDQCIVVDTPGSNECINDSDCLFKAQGHTECRNEQCIAVDASGFDECINDSDCFTIRDTHTECQEDQCVSVQGPGSNECINNQDCEVRALGHTQCRDNQCIVIPGSGTDQCINHSDCDPALSLQHTVCEDSACVMKDGSGTNQCINNSDCAREVIHQAVQTHTQCQNNQCIEVPGSGINMCSTDRDCLVPQHTICQSNLCIVVPGEGDNECVSDENCIDVLPATNVASASMCGDGVIQFPEECDDSNTRDNDGCSSQCTEESIPDFIYQPKPTIEQPEDKETEVLSVALSNDSNPTIHKPLCGNSTIDPNEECDLGLHNSDTKPNACRTNCTLPICGDRVIDLNEDCDDGNSNNNDTCSNTCTKAALILQPNPNPIPDPLKPSAPPFDSSALADSPRAGSSQQAIASTIPFAISQPQPTAPQAPTYQPLAYQVPLVQYQIPQRAPIGDTGPASIAVIALGSALGYSIRKRSRARSRSRRNAILTLT